MSDWLRCCDVIVTKAGPGTIGEAACCGTPLLLTGHIPGQEKGNAEIVTGAGAGLWVPGVRQLVAEIGRLRRDRGAIEAMGVASVRLGRPDAAGDIARLIADLIPASVTAVRAGPCARL
jgi:1,2-diacylglycerol 3-beta-galactosyltransferase